MDLGQEQADAQSLGGHQIAMGAGRPFDDTVQTQPAQIVGHALERIEIGRFVVDPRLPQLPAGIPMPIETEAGGVGKVAGEFDVQRPEVRLHQVK